MLIDLFEAIVFVYLDLGVCVSIKNLRIFILSVVYRIRYNSPAQFAELTLFWARS